MERNKNELSTFSFNEINLKKEKQKENKMPPPSLQEYVLKYPEILQSKNSEKI